MPSGTVTRSASLARTAVDTSVLVAALVDWHDEHERARRALDRALADPPVVVPQHALLEAYSVLTRLPAPHRLSPSTAVDLLEQTLRGAADLPVLPPEDAWTFLAHLRDQDVAGGTSYDALIVESADRAGARTILTLNRRHFERLTQEMEIEALTP